MYRWFLGLFGFFIYRIPGFFVGFFIGSIIDNGGIRRVNSNIVKEFEINLLSLASILIKSDGKISVSELQFVRNYFISIYGPQKANNLFSDLIKRLINLTYQLKKYVFSTDLGHLTKLDYKLLTFCLMLQNQMAIFLILN